MAKPTSLSVGEPSTPTQDEIVLKDLRAKYEQAVGKQNEAKARLAQLSVKDTEHTEKSCTIGRGPGIAVLRQRQLGAHLENLRLQKRYRNLRLLCQYAEQADHIASDEGIFDAQESTIRSVTDPDDSDQVAALTATQKRLEALHKDATSRTSDLEIALVRSQQQLKWERNLLDKARTYSKTGQNGTGISESGLAKQRAMEATRDELQNWIAESLVRCEREISPPVMNTLATRVGVVEQSEEEIEAAIEKEYEQYLEVRLRLVNSAKNLKKPLASSESEVAPIPGPRPPVEVRPRLDDQRHRFPTQRAPHLRHKSRISVHKLAEQTGDSSLTKTESSYLARYHHERLLTAHMTNLEGQTTAQDARLLQGLGLLSHESHLLPSYPLSSTNNTKTDQLKGLSQQQLDIEQLLSAWGFASDTAEEVLKESVLGNVEETKEALVRARQHLKEIQIMETMRKEVAMY